MAYGSFLLMESAMTDMLKHLGRLRADAAKCALTSGLANDPAKRRLFATPAEDLRVLAG